MKVVYEHESQTIVRFHCLASKAQSVCLAGTFNHWDPRSTSMRRISGGEWITDVELAPGKYEFLFVVDGRWCSIPGEGGVDETDPHREFNDHKKFDHVNCFEVCSA